MDNKELQTIISNSPLVPTQTTVHQHGDRSVHIDHVENMSQNVILVPISSHTPVVGQPTPTQAISTDYYHLFVLGGETFEQDHFLVPADRALCQYWMSEDLRNKYGPLSAEAVDELKRFPALFMPETEGYYAKALDGQFAHFGLVTNIRVQDNGIKVYFHKMWSMPLQSICNIGFNLGLKDMGKALTELNRTHWVIKKINLIEELRDANLTCGIL